MVPPKCVPEIYNGECHANHVRKMQASFAWDWGPAFPSMGLWKTVYINAYNETYIKDVSFQVVADGDKYKFTVTVYMAPNTAKQLDGVLRITLGNNHAVDLWNFEVQGVATVGNEFIIQKEFRQLKVIILH